MMTSTTTTVATASTSRHTTSPINGPLNTDGPIPPRLRGSPFLAAVSSSAPSSSASSSSSSLPTLSTLSQQQNLPQSQSPYSYTPALNNFSDSALPQSLASSSSSNGGLWLDRAELLTTTSRPVAAVTTSPIKLHLQQQHQQRTRLSHTRAVSLSGSDAASTSSLVPLDTSASTLSSSASSSTTVVYRPGTPIPASPPKRSGAPLLPHSHSLPIPPPIHHHQQRIKSPLGPSPHITIPPPPTMLPGSISPLAISSSSSSALVSTPYPYPYSLDGPAFDSALDDSSDTSEEGEEYFDSCSSAYVSPSSSSSTSSTSSNESLDAETHRKLTFSDSSPTSMMMISSGATAKSRVLRPRGQSTPSLARSADMNVNVNVDAYFAAAAALSLGSSGQSPSAGSGGGADIVVRGGSSL